MSQPGAQNNTRRGSLRCAADPYAFGVALLLLAVIYEAMRRGTVSDGNSP